MATREEIRKVIDAYVDDECLYPSTMGVTITVCVYRCRGYCNSGDDGYKCLMKRLGELGVVIKVDRELPGPYASYWLKESYKIVQRDMLDDGYTAWEPLIEVRTTKQEEIREEIYERSHQIIEENIRADGGFLTLEGLHALFEYLHSQGVVITERIPEVPPPGPPQPIIKGL